LAGGELYTVFAGTGSWQGESFGWLGLRSTGLLGREEVEKELFTTKERRSTKRKYRF